MTIDELIAALEKAEGPSSEIDADIGLTAAGWEPWLSKLPPFTSSLDAALTLVPEGLMWSVGTNGDGRYRADVWTDVVEIGIGCSPAIALCIAALEARRNA